MTATHLSRTSAITAPPSTAPPSTALSAPWLSHAQWPHPTAFHRHDVWFHGTPWAYDGLPGTPETWGTTSLDWNALIGPHVSSSPLSADLFTVSEHWPSNWENLWETGRVGDWHDEHDAPRIFPLRLRSARNLHFACEADLGMLAIDLSVRQGARTREDYGLPNGPESPEERFSANSGLSELYRDEQETLATLLRVHLLAEGYDTLTYTNFHEGGIAAITLNPSSLVSLYS